MPAGTPALRGVNQAQLDTARAAAILCVPLLAPKSNFSEEK
jgi:hypothetical protein